MTLLPSSSDPKSAGRYRQALTIPRALRREAVWAKESDAALPQPRRRAVLVAFRDRRRLEAALAALPSLGFAASDFGILGTPTAFETLLAGRFRAAPTHRLRPFLVLDSDFAGQGGSRPVMKPLRRLPGHSLSEVLLVSEGWPLPLPMERADQAAICDRNRTFGAIYGRPVDMRSPAVLLGLRLADARPAASVCQALLAINNGPVELLDLRAP